MFWALSTTRDYIWGENELVYLLVILCTSHSMLTKIWEAELIWKLSWGSLAVQTDTCQIHYFYSPSLTLSGMILLPYPPPTTTTTTTQSTPSPSPLKPGFVVKVSTNTLPPLPFSTLSLTCITCFAQSAKNSSLLRLRNASSVNFFPNSSALSSNPPYI